MGVTRDVAHRIGTLIDIGVVKRRVGDDIVETLFALEVGEIDAVYLRIDAVEREIVLRVSAHERLFVHSDGFGTEIPAQKQREYAHAASDIEQSPFERKLSDEIVQKDRIAVVTISCRRLIKKHTLHFLTNFTTF